jgi:hypothetical protein
MVIVGVLTVPLTYWVGRAGELGALLKERLQTLGNPFEKLIRTYDRNTYAAEKRDALDKWATHLKSVVAQATGPM